MPLSFSVRLRRLLVLFGCIGFVLVFSVSAFFEYRQYRKDVAAVMKGAAASCAALIREYLLQNDRFVQEIIEQRPLEGGPRAVADYFVDRLPMTGPLDHYFILDRQKRVIRTGKGDESFVGLDFSHLEYLEPAREITKVHQSLVGLTPVVTMLYQLGEGCLLLVEKDLNSLTPLVGHLTISGPLQKAFVFILSQTGTVVYHPDAALGRSRHPLGFELKMLGGPDEYGLVSYAHRGEKFIAYRQALNPPQGWTFYAAIPRAEVRDLVLSHLASLALSIGFFFLLAIVVLNILIDRRLSRPLASFAKFLSRQNLLSGGPLAVPPEAVDNLELARIVEATNAMATNARIANDKLQESEELFRTVTEFSTDWTFWLSPTREMIYVSPSCLAITGYAPEEFYADPGLMKKMMHPEDKALGINHIDHAVSDEAHDPIEYRILTKDGRVRWLSHVCRAIYNGKGEFLGVRGSNSDITARKEAEETLLESEARFHTLMEQGADGFIVHDFDGRIRDVNRRMCELSGHAREELLRMYMHELDPRFSQEEMKKTYTGIETGKPIFFESRQCRKDGGEYPVEIAVSVVSWGGKRIVFSMVRDITDRKKAEEELAAEKELLAVTLRSIGDGVITTDSGGRVVMLSKAAEHLTGWSEKEAIGRMLDEIFQIFDEKTHEPVLPPIAEVLRTGRIVGLAPHTLLKCRDGGERLIADSGAPIRDKKSRIIGVVLVFRDVTEARQLEQEMQKAQKLESLGVLAGGIAHDFNNLLTAVLGNIAFARLRLPEDAEVQTKLAAAEKASLRAQGLTLQLLTFAKGGAPVKEVASMDEIIRDSIAFSLRGSNVRCDLELADGLHHVEVDAGQMSQVLNNLIVNADQAMPQGGVIHVVCGNAQLDYPNEMDLAPGSYVRISIRDEGAGIAADVLPRIFDPYFSTKKGGRGLGLASSYSIVRRHGGRIMVSSQPGLGSTFTVYLPASGKALRAVEPRAAEKIVGGKGKVLVMDDEEMVRDLAGEVLRALGYEAVMAEDGVAALARYREAQAAGRPFAAVIMDLTIPGGMGGREAVQELRKIDPQAKVIVSSGYAQDPIMANHAEYGFDEVLAKPYSLQKLAAVLQSVIQA
ncbi:PAS domain S-box protein [Thiovibrio sp. JS02]